MRARPGQRLSLVACSALFLTISSRAAVTVAQFRDDRPGAMSFTFDDGSQTQYDPAVSYLDEFGLKGSFYVIAGLTRETQDDPLDPRIPATQTWARVSWDQWAVVLAGGHEIGNHSMTHRHLPTLSPEELQIEIVGAKQLIEEKLGTAPLTFVCPFNDGRGDNTISSLILDLHIALRMTEYTYGSAGRDTLAEVNQVADNAVAGRKWNVAMIHGIGEPWSPLDPTVCHDHFAYCKGLVDAGDLWIETFANVTRYTQERADVTPEVQSSSASRVVFTATLGSTGLDPAVYDYPLTFVINTTPVTAALATAIRGGTIEDIPLTIESDRILLDAAPGPGAVTLAWTTDAANEPPVVDAGGDRAVAAGETLDLAGSVTDGTVPGDLVSWWELVSGPEQVSFDPADSEVSSVTFGVEGEYVIRLCADDGELVAYDAVVVTVSRPASDSNGGGCHVCRQTGAPGGAAAAFALAAAIFGGYSRLRRRRTPYPRLPILP